MVLGGMVTGKPIIGSYPDITTIILQYTSHIIIRKPMHRIVRDELFRSLFVDDTFVYTISIASQPQGSILCLTEAGYFLYQARLRII